MNEEVQKLVDSGKLQGRYGDALSALDVGVYCLHKSWGVGKVASWDLLGDRIYLDFEGKSNHGMKLEFAAKSLKPISEDHILAKRLEKLEELQQLAVDDPVTLMQEVVSCYNNSMLLDQVEEVLKGTVVSDEKYRTWWDNAKKKMRQNRLFVVPSKRNVPLELRPSDLNIEDGLLEDFTNARELKAKVAAVDAIVKDLEQIENAVDKLRPVVESINEAASKSQRLQTAAAIELIAARERLQEAVPDLAEGLDKPAISEIVIENESNLRDIIGQLPAAGQRRIYEAFEPAFGDRWSEVLFGLINVVNLRGVGDVARLAIDREKGQELEDFLKLGIQQRSLSTEVLAWICKERRRLAESVFGPELASAAINALERDHYDDDAKKSNKLQDILMADSLLVSDLLEEASRNQIRMFARRLKNTPAIEDLSRNSLLARVIKAHPDIQQMVTGEADDDEVLDEGLIVSWDSIEKRKAQLEDIIKNKIPENTKEISVAASYGDLRENFEFKAAKDQQAVLMRQKDDLEMEINAARGTDFADADASKVGVGTVVTIKEGSSKSETYSILGAWDTDLDQGIISYLSATGKALSGHKEGDEVEIHADGDGPSRTVKIEKIGAYAK
jgi:transcription elongation GreA/GreB family factor